MVGGGVFLSKSRKQDLALVPVTLNLKALANELENLSFSGQCFAEWLAYIFPNGIRGGRVMAFIKAMEYTGWRHSGCEGYVLHLA